MLCALSTGALKHYIAWDIVWCWDDWDIPSSRNRPVLLTALSISKGNPSLFFFKEEGTNENIVMDYFPYSVLAYVP